MPTVKEVLLNGTVGDALGISENSVFQRIADITKSDLSKGGTINDLLCSTMEELGEFSTAHSVESGYKKRDLAESAASEAVDLTICALALFFAKGGTIDDFIEIADWKLNKWESKHNDVNDTGD